MRKMWTNFREFEIHKYITVIHVSEYSAKAWNKNV